MLMLLSYGLFVLLLAVLLRNYRTGDEFLMADRRASPLLVAAALFTLVGGGELVTLTALAYSYGLSALALFLGYALGFLLLAVLAPRVRRDADKLLHLSLPDYVHHRFGLPAGTIVFGISFVSFFALLLIQFTAAGHIVGPMTGLSYHQAVLATAAIAIVYLAVGGFRTVLATDVVQGIAMIVLMPALVLLAAGPLSTRPWRISAAPLPPELWLGLTITGFFVAASSADVWQRIYVARTDRAARVGLVAGAVLLMVFGVALVGLGVVARESGQISAADNAFTGALTQLLPSWGVALAVILVLSTILSTADTEMFLLSGMAVREWIRWRARVAGAEIAGRESVLATRIVLGVITIAAVMLALVITELIPIYMWLLSAILVIAPVVLFALFRHLDRGAATASLFINLILFLLLAAAGWLTLDSAWLIVVPGFVTVAIATINARRPG